MNRESCAPPSHPPRPHTHTFLKEGNFIPFFGRKCAGNHNAFCLLVLKVYPHTFQSTHEALPFCPSQKLASTFWLIAIPLYMNC